MAKTSAQTAKEVAKLLNGQEVVNNPNFFEALDNQLRKLGLFLECSQQGVRGTHVQVSNLQE
jgi:hypothetical protein